ncbi:phosphodiesterase [Dictyobacter alpinus]|uniref:Phosphodiesterase n=1 Tax=Dictyobacter alpinus TaxID=2014873 RepID=A0A402B3M9_9CHLR|nr:alkaline phosphatase family protein [Dictyobacter alpinus]GCE25955.1 phosphodiesterase [Dictyobacter alpinus]
MPHAPRLLIIGLDCAEPSLMFEHWLADLPTISRLIAQGSYGRLESCVPAITVPAWSCMMSGRDPGELGIYGFRNRADRSYQRMVVADGRAVRVPRLWDILGEAGWQVATLGVPGTYPPYPVNGALVSCFLTPSTELEYTYPAALAGKIATWVDDYLLDVPDFRSEDKERILRDIYKMCDQHFTVAEQLLVENEPDMLMMVDMGVDRIHHALWKYMDPQHPHYTEHPRLSDAIHAYYQHVDGRIAQLLQHCSEETAVLVVSDHGARPLMGGVRINEWLQQQGYLSLRQVPESPMPLDHSAIDWQQTRAWSAGGYYGRIFMNVRGREPAGIISPAAYERERTALAEHLRSMLGPDQQPLGNRVFVPQQLYRNVRGIAPDLVVYFGDLAWRALGTVGGGELYSTENDTGPDDANHAQHGLFIFHDPQHPDHGQEITNASIYDILPTLLARYGLQPPAGLSGKTLPLAALSRPV